jgi:protein SCO1/2
MATYSGQKRHLKLVLLLLLFSAIVTFIVIYFGVVHPQKKAHDLSQVKIDGVVIPETKNINDFHFTDQYGSSFTKTNLQGHWTMLFFGFTNCGYVCPTTLSALNKMYQMLEEESIELPQVVLVSVDPERDSVARMKEYISTFNSRFIGVRGEQQETDAFTHQLHISAVKMQADGEGNDHYMINHSAEILLINPEGKIQAYLSYPHQAEQMAKDYKAILTAYS